MSDAVKEEWFNAFWEAAVPVMPRSMTDAIEAGLAAVVPLVRADERSYTRTAAGVRADAKRQIDEARAEVATLTELRAAVDRLTEAAFALTDHDPSPLVWKSDVLDLLDSRIDKPKE